MVTVAAPGVPRMPNAIVAHAPRAAVRGGLGPARPAGLGPGRAPARRRPRRGAGARGVARRPGAACPTSTCRAPASACWAAARPHARGRRPAGRRGGGRPGPRPGRRPRAGGASSALVRGLCPADARDRTGALSATLLALAARGAAPEPVHRLLGGRGSRGRPRRSAAPRGLDRGGDRGRDPHRGRVSGADGRLRPPRIVAVRPRSATVRGRSPMIRPLTTLGLGAALAALALPIPSAGAGEAPPTSPTADQADQATVFTFTGRGWGHGVGMSQYGARGRALAGLERVPASCAPTTAAPPSRWSDQRPVRVLLSAGRRSAFVWSPVAWRAVGARANGRGITPLRAGATYRITTLPTGRLALMRDGRRVAVFTGPMRVQARTAGGWVAWGPTQPEAARRYHGGLRAVPTGAGFDLVNVVGLDDLCPGGRAARDAGRLGRRRLRGAGRPGRGHAQLRALHDVAHGRLRRLRRRPQPGLRRRLRGGPPHHPGRQRHPRNGRDVPWRRHHDLLLLDLGRAHRGHPERLPRRNAAPLPGERAGSLR